MFHINRDRAMFDSIAVPSGRGSSDSVFDTGGIEASPGRAYQQAWRFPTAGKKWTKTPIYDQNIAIFSLSLSICKFLRHFGCPVILRQTHF
jgi:hypothetical protein